jgi:hypothetical protein
MEAYMLKRRLALYKNIHVYDKALKSIEYLSGLFVLPCHLVQGAVFGRNLTAPCSTVCSILCLLKVK